CLRVTSATRHFKPDPLPAGHFVRRSYRSAPPAARSENGYYPVPRPRIVAPMETISGLDPEALNRARISRDPRFDGKFYIAVTSTGIYCRPICPSRYAKRSNVRFFGSPAAAEG